MHSTHTHWLFGKVSSGDEAGRRQRAIPVGQKTDLGRQWPKGTFACGRALVAEGGIRRLYRGYGYTLLRAGPVAGIILPAFELLLDFFERRATPT